MKRFMEYLRNEISPLLRSRKNLVSLLVLGILILSLFIGIGMLRNRQIIKSRASGETPITFTGPNVRKKPDGSMWLTTSPQVQIQITSPFGGPAGGGQ